ncbi:MAG: NapC/NirT family cytochrome c [Coriobacteriia bacterium]|nr:NapC/NirT family cytochrome c [Coriobacteriia bacterium]
MAFHPIEAFKNPVSRPRAIIWCGTVLVALLLFVTVAMAATTSFWFCSAVCHLQTDSINSYLNSSHSKVACVSCHYKPGKDPVSFVFAKITTAIAELPPTIMGTYHIPINAYSDLALNKYEFGDERCNSCHTLENRTITPSPGIVIDHKIHEDFGVTCTMCHNRVGHNEDGIELVLFDPQSGEPAFPHEDFMLMTACYRCHDMETNKPATGDCLACHTEDFHLIPDNHYAPDLEAFLGRPHADLGLEAYALVEKTMEKHGIDVEPNSATKTEDMRKITADTDGSWAKKYARSHGEGELVLAPVGAINYCYTCHLTSFCDDCHGMAMPHPTEFLRPRTIEDPEGHAAMSYDPYLMEKCIMCHGVEEETKFCTSCHHGPESNWTFNYESDWTTAQHAEACYTTGVSICLQACHTTQFCIDCHDAWNVYPVSHESATFTWPATPSMTIYGVEPAKTTAEHAVMANQSIESCEICHGEGGINAPFCYDCHGMEMPHDSTFRAFHSASDPSTCTTCHGYAEVCSSCHHIGATAQSRWMPEHGPATLTHSADTCNDCHTNAECVDCHWDWHVVPGTHAADDFLQRAHVTQFEADPQNCLFCHAGDAATLPNSAYCIGCHVLEMPHPTDSSPEVFPHSEAIKSGQYTRPQCALCHTQVFCDACHHVQSVPDQPWYYYHAVVTRTEGARGCYDCHQESFCSFCHVRVSRGNTINR